MPPPMMRISTLLTRLPSSSSLVDTLAPPTIAATGRFGTAERGLQRLELLLHRAPRIGGKLVGEPLGRRMGAVGGGEGVVDVDVAELGERLDMGRIVLLLALVEAGVLEQEHVAVRSSSRSRRRPSCRCSRLAKATGRLMISATAAATGLSELASSGPPLGRPKWASRMTLPPLSAISSMVGATRSMRVASVTRPFSVGTLRSTRRSTRLPATSASSSVRKGFVIGPHKAVGRHRA